jgi:hypothetical protein
MSPERNRGEFRTGPWLTDRIGNQPECVSTQFLRAWDADPVRLIRQLNRGGSLNSLLWFDCGVERYRGTRRR